MYIRYVRYAGRAHYELRRSYWDGSCYRMRRLMDLGDDPQDYIVYVGGNGFYFRPDLEEALEDQGVGWETEDLERAFLPYLDPHIRRIIENFTHAPRGQSSSPDPLGEAQAHLHPFDKRRLHFLRCGRMDMGNLEGRPWKFLNVLLEKSRDEMEHVIEGMEVDLRPHERRNYLFTALELQRYFPHHLLKNNPAALDPERVDSYFLQEICRLNESRHFFAGVEDHDPARLHPYLVKYVIMYFDHSFSADTFLDEMLRDFIWNRQFRFPQGPPRASMPEKEACACLGIGEDEYRSMSPEELARCYKRCAKRHHPDAGGDHETFIRMAEAYEVLARRKGP
ncbi:hypothetical protein SAMN02746041_02877 [Desulfacinum hydrothermale DSM 13146]|uniref:J domain-containing protein n=1 Tax=Desulfacinum hydrothermale DSM 13146 TaxID=1121390 RepID=A0A1W1XT39_9BACT|nr:J domain-containing protein [Desulfacinum hydrothermale]SMC27140.1 hypothetical protein SAMN02746041_02877 [Desulfacinum hydrothermale DSM 13146]